MFVGEPTTSISIMPPSQFLTATDSVAEPDGYSVGEMMSGSGVTSTHPVASNDDPPKSMDNSARQPPVRTVLKPAKIHKTSLVAKDPDQKPTHDPTVVELKDDLAAETKQPVINNNDLAAIKARSVPNVKTDVELPIQAPVGGASIFVKPSTDQLIKIPAVRVNPVKLNRSRLPDRTVRDDGAAKKIARINNRAKKKAQKIAAKKKLAKAAALKAQISNNWKSAILGED